MNINITRKLAGIVAVLTGRSLGIGEAIAKRLAPDRVDVASVFVTNGGYNGVQQVLRLVDTAFAKAAFESNCDERLSQNGENH
jgi:NAD(P)-dependent dehydrogenase (short-subunit alcohol dehydrogenase family)